MHGDYQAYLGKVIAEAGTVPTPVPALRVVRSQDGTERPGIYLTSPETKQFTGGPVNDTNGNPADVDGLFGDSLAYQSYKKEKFEHRLMLWHRLKGLSVKETAALTGYTPQSVSQICKQPWFREAFVRLAAEMGKDAVQTLIEGAVVPAFQRLEELATSAESESVQFAANKELIDRFLGKTVAKTEMSITQKKGDLIQDIEKLQKENAEVQRELAARGIGQHGTN